MNLSGTRCCYYIEGCIKGSITHNFRGSSCMLVRVASHILVLVNSIAQDTVSVSQKSIQIVNL